MRGMNRRDFARLLSLTAAAASIATAAPPVVPTGSRRSPVKPKRLAAGDAAGLVLPASARSPPAAIDFAKDQLEAVGFKVVIGRHARDRWGYFAGRDRDRAADINEMFAGDAVGAVVCYTGGWGM